MDATATMEATETITQLTKESHTMDTITHTHVINTTDIGDDASTYIDSNGHPIGCYTTYTGYPDAVTGMIYDDPSRYDCDDAINAYIAAEYTPDESDPADAVIEYHCLSVDDDADTIVDAAHIRTHRLISPSDLAHIWDTHHTSRMTHYIWTLTGGMAGWDIDVDVIHSDDRYCID